MVHVGHVHYWPKPGYHPLAAVAAAGQIRPARDVWDRMDRWSWGMTKSQWSRAGCQVGNRRDHSGPALLNEEQPVVQVAVDKTEVLSYSSYRLSIYDLRERVRV